MNKTKIIFKRKLFAFQDMLITKKMAQKSRNYIRSLPACTVQNNYHVNDIANTLHPREQSVRVSNIISHKCGAKTFILESSNNKKLAYFRAGQYISITFKIANTNISRPYSLCSSPKDAIEKGFYAITVKPKPDGLISSHILKNIKINDLLITSGPEGEFYYNELRDPKHIIAIAAGSGITPFVSLAKAIVEQTENFNLTIVMRNRSYDSILFLQELSELERLSNNKIKIIHSLSREKYKHFHYGNITLSLIKPYVTPATAIWMCGPKKMYSDLLTIIEPLKLLQKNIRIEYNNDIGLPNNYPEYKNIGHKSTYIIKIKQFDNQYSIVASAHDTILVSLQKAQLSTQSKCLSGVCSWCRIKVLKGEVFTPKDFSHLRAADRTNEIYYSCSAFPISDLDIEVN